MPKCCRFHLCGHCSLDVALHPKAHSTYAPSERPTGHFYMQNTVSPQFPFVAPPLRNEQAPTICFLV